MQKSPSKSSLRGASGDDPANENKENQDANQSIFNSQNNSKLNVTFNTPKSLSLVLKDSALPIFKHELKASPPQKQLDLKLKLISVSLYLEID